MLLMKTLVLLCLVCFSTAATTDGGTDCDGIRNCSEATFDVCIKYYKELELYVTHSTVIIDELKSTFFFTGDYPSKYVKLIYNFQVSVGVANSTGVTNCVNQTSTYIWSESALYLLGQTLVWSTFFALDISGYRITIDLPCLCHDEYSELLSRLTYMVSVLYIALICKCALITQVIPLLGYIFVCKKGCGCSTIQRFRYIYLQGFDIR